MDQQQRQQVEQQLRQNWNQVKHQILDQFAQVSTADLDSAQNAQDLVERIADKSNHSERFVETRIAQLVGVGSGSTSGGQQQQPFSQSGQPGSNPGQQGSMQRFGTSQQ